MAVCGLIGHRAINLTQLINVLRPVRYAPAYIQELIKQENPKSKKLNRNLGKYSKI